MKTPFSTKTASLALAVAATLFSAVPAHAVPVLGLTDTNSLFTFDSATPASKSAFINVTGLGAGENLVGIDRRPTTGVLYGVSNQGRVFSIAATGAATLLGTVPNISGATVVGIDFNPEADRQNLASLRVITSTGQNGAFNVGAAVPSYTAQTAIQANLTSIAYSNNDTDAGTATSLYFIDSSSNELKLATSNFGNPTITTVGALGFDAGNIGGFDIFGASTAFAALQTGNGNSNFYSINLTTGLANLIGGVNLAGNGNVIGLTSASVAAAVPEPASVALMLAGLFGVGSFARKRRSTGR